MKKQSLLLITGGILALASCNTDTGNADNAQATIDSMVDARVEEIRMELEMKNDSIINELAMYRADSIMAAMKGKKVTRTRPAAKSKPVLSSGSSDGGSSSQVEPADKPSGMKAKADANKQSGADKFKSKADDNKQSGKDKFKSRAD